MRHRFALLAAIFLLLLAAVSLYGFRHLGYWLELDEPLRKSQAIVVLGGGTPYRAMEAADLYKAKWADQVWLTEGAPDGRDIVLARIGIEPSPEYEYNELVLTKLGVPKEAIRVIPDRVENTVAEEKAILRYAGSDQRDSVILVSSKAHTRRVRVVWDSIGGNRVAAIVRYTQEEPYDAARWWSNTSDALATFRELFGILNARAGFPIEPRNDR